MIFTTIDIIKNTTLKSKRIRCIGAQLNTLPRRVHITTRSGAQLSKRLDSQGSRDKKNELPMQYIINFCVLEFVVQPEKD